MQIVYAGGWVLVRSAAVCFCGQPSSAEKGAFSPENLVQTGETGKM
ncbi:MAG: hypothetical protein J1F40_06120 [Prevotellaceae bacterium]|nr:hypothetical protein [Prevotellaceae bacterium]